MRTLRTLTATVAVAISALALAATASAKTMTESASAPLAGGGSVSATLSWTPDTKLDADTHISLSITRAGQQLVAGPLKSKQCPEFCIVTYGGNGPAAVHAADLLGTGEPVVYVDLYTGGAHCCSVTEFFTYNAATGAYVQSEHDWGDPGYSIVHLNGKDVFWTDNDAFAYEFTDYAASGMPTELFSFTGTKMVNVTRDYPSRIAKDAAFWLKTYKSQASSGYQDSVGIIAAWAADEDELGRSAFVASYLKQQAAAGHLNSAIGPEEAGGTKFIAKLNKFLKAQGYLK